MRVDEPAWLVTVATDGPLPDAYNRVDAIAGALAENESVAEPKAAVEPGTGALVATFTVQTRSDERAEELARDAFLAALAAAHYDVERAGWKVVVSQPEQLRRPAGELHDEFFEHQREKHWERITAVMREYTGDPDWPEPHGGIEVLTVPARGYPFFRITNASHTGLYGYCVQADPPRTPDAVIEIDPEGTKRVITADGVLDVDDEFDGDAEEI